MRRSTTTILLAALSIPALAACRGAVLDAAGAPETPLTTAAQSLPACTREAIDAALPASARDYFTRAWDWVDRTVMYCQCVTGAGGRYRTDCSGYVSYVWGLDAPGHTTYSLAGGPWDDGASYAIDWSELQPGDALNFGGDPKSGHGHVMLFGGWLDEAHTRVCVVEESKTGTPAHVASHSLFDAGKSWGGSGLFRDIFLPIRYVGFDPGTPVTPPVTPPGGEMNPPPAPVTLGPVKSGAVTITVNPTNGIRDLYAVAADGTLKHTWAEAQGPWRGWDVMGTGFTTRVAATAHPASGIRDVYAINDRGELMHTWAERTGQWRGWDTVGAGFQGWPAATASVFSGLREVYAVAANGDLMHTWAEAEGPWRGWDVAGSGFRGSPAATAHPGNGIRDVYGIDAGGQLQHNWAWSTGQWKGWDVMGSGFQGAPAATASAVSGLREVYAIGGNGKLLHNWSEAADAWRGWDPVGDGFQGSPVVTTSGFNGYRDVYAIGVSGTLMHTWAEQRGPWRGWDTIGQGFTGSPNAAVSTGTGIRDVIATDANGALQHNWAADTGQWRGFDLP